MATHQHAVRSKEARRRLRSTIFRHLDGIATGPTAFALLQAGVIDYIQTHRSVQLRDLAAHFAANAGYLNVALRILASQGWLLQQIDHREESIRYSLTDSGEIAFSYLELYREAVQFIPHAINLEDYILTGFPPAVFERLQQLFNGYQNNFGMQLSTDDDKKKVELQILKHIEGLIAGPLIVSLGIHGLFHKYFSIAPFGIEEFSQHHKELGAVIDFFSYLGWFTKRSDIYNFTPQGLFFAKRASAYGVTVSYLPTFRQIPELLFGNPTVLWEKPPNTPEIHVNRSMNVWGSGGAHANYFKKIDEVIIDLFNRPIHQQPKGFADMGSGNGALLEHLFEIIWSRTNRGQILEEYPLFIVGSDFNEAALAATRRTLNQADIWAKAVWGDIGRPDLLAKQLQDKYEIKLGDLLNVRSFLDHNRIYQPPEKIDPERISTSTGAFAFRGRLLPNREVEQNLVEHLTKWKPYVQRFGLLVIELHTLPPAIAARNIGRTAVTAYDGTHGYSDQYIVELDNFLSAAKEAGLHPDPKHQAKFPNSELATVSINLLRSEEYI